VRCRLGAGDHGVLRPQRDDLLVPFRAAQAPYADLFLEHQPALDHDDLLHDGKDRHVAFLANGRHSLDRAADRHPLDLDPLMRQRLVDELLVLVRDRRDADSPVRPAPGDHEGLGQQRHRQRAGVGVGDGWHAVRLFRLQGWASRQSRRGTAPGIQ